MQSQQKRLPTEAESLNSNLCEGVLSVLENRFDSGRRIRQREQLITDAIFVAETFERFINRVVINFACARFVTTGAVRNVNVSDLVDVFFDVVAQRAFVVLHVIGVEQNHQPRRAD